MGFEDEYVELQKRSWNEPLENVSHMIASERKRLVPFHSKENHDFMVKRWGHCLYCDNGIPLEDTRIGGKKQ